MKQQNYRSMSSIMVANMRGFKPQPDRRSFHVHPRCNIKIHVLDGEKWSAWLKSVCLSYGAGSESLHTCLTERGFPAIWVG